MTTAVCRSKKFRDSSLQQQRIPNTNDMNCFYNSTFSDQFTVLHK